MPPRPARAYQARTKPTLARVQDFIDRILTADRMAPQKQRHTARRIYDRLCRERPDAPVAASTVRKYVGVTCRLSSDQSFLENSAP